MWIRMRTSYCQNTWLLLVNEWLNMLVVGGGRKLRQKFRPP